jgi:hypothetical protein
MKYLFIFSLPFFLLNSCVKEKCQIAGFYEFEIPATLTPDKDTFQVGDTITFVSSFEDQVFERKTKKFYKLENFKFYPELSMAEVSDSATNKGALVDFDVIIDSMINFHRIDYTDGQIDYIGEYNYVSNKYSLDFKLVPRIPGLYVLYFSSYVWTLDKNQKFDGKCSNINVDGVVKMNDGTDNNIEMLKNSPDPHYNEWIFGNPSDRFHRNGGYCFYVK